MCWIINLICDNLATVLPTFPKIWQICINLLVTLVATRAKQVALQNNIMQNDIQQNDTRLNDIQQNDIQQNDTKPNAIQQNDTQQNDVQQNDTKPNAIRVTRLGEISTFGRFIMALGEFFSRKIAQ